MNETFNQSPIFRESIEAYRPNRNKISQLLLCGFVATSAMVILGYAFALFGVPAIDFAATYGAILNGQTFPDPDQGVWWLGLFWHFVNGVVLFPLLFDYLSNQNALPNQRRIKGLTIGISLWLFVETVVLPIAGAEFFGRLLLSPNSFAVLNLITWMIYGLTLETVLRVRFVHHIEEQHREVA